MTADRGKVEGLRRSTPHRYSRKGWEAGEWRMIWRTEAGEQGGLLQDGWLSRRWREKPKIRMAKEQQQSSLSLTHSVPTA